MEDRDKVFIYVGETINLENFKEVVIKVSPENLISVIT